MFEELKKHFQEKKFAEPIKIIEQDKSINWKETDIEDVELFKFIVEHCNISDLRDIALKTKFQETCLIERIVNNDPGFITTLITENTFLDDLIFYYHSRSLTPKELAILFSRNDKYIDPFFDKHNYCEQQGTLILSIIGRLDINRLIVLTERGEELTKLSLETCIEYLIIKKDMLLIPQLNQLLREISIPKTLDEKIFDAIAKCNFKRFLLLITNYPKNSYTIQDFPFGKFIIKIFEAKFTKAFDFMCRRESSHDILLHVLQQQNFRLFNFMLLVPEVKHLWFFFKLAMIPSLKHHVSRLLEYRNFEYYKTVEGLLDLIRQDPVAVPLFKEIIKCPIVTGNILDELLTQIDFKYKEHVRWIIQTKKCSPEKIIYVSKLFRDVTLQQI